MQEGHHGRERAATMGQMLVQSHKRKEEIEKEGGKERERKSQKNDSIIPNPSLPIPNDIPTTPVKREKKRKVKNYCRAPLEASYRALLIGKVYESRSERKFRAYHINKHEHQPTGPSQPTTLRKLNASRNPPRSSFCTSTTQCSKLSMRTLVLVSCTTSWKAIPNRLRRRCLLL